MKKFNTLDMACYIVINYQIFRFFNCNLHMSILLDVLVLIVIGVQWQKGLARRIPSGIYAASDLATTNLQNSRQSNDA